MLSFSWPWLLVILPLPWLYRLMVKPINNTAPALRSEIYTRIARKKTSSAPVNKTWLAQILLALIWASLLVAATKPTWVGEPIALPTNGRDLLIAVDISGSMETADMQLGNKLYPRIDIVKSVLGDFVKKRQGDRLGLILFGSQAYLQTPLTFDHKTLYTLLQEAQIGFAGKSTAIGDAIGIAVKRLKTRPEESRVLILLSDGADTGSEIPPLKAAELAAKYNIKIYTIGVGAERITRRSLFGTRQINPSSDLDEATLTAIAEQTGGRYFRARDPQQLANIYEILEALEPIDQEAEIFRPTHSLFYWPLAVASLFFIFLLLLYTKNSTARGQNHV